MLPTVRQGRARRSYEPQRCPSCRIDCRPFSPGSSNHAGGSRAPARERTHVVVTSRPVQVLRPRALCAKRPARAPTSAAIPFGLLVLDRNGRLGVIERDGRLGLLDSRCGRCLLRHGNVLRRLGDGRLLLLLLLDGRLCKLLLLNRGRRLLLRLGLLLLLLDRSNCLLLSRRGLLLDRSGLSLCRLLNLR